MAELPAPGPAPRKRKSMRLSGYDYSRPGAYFITLCTYNRECLLGEIIQGSLRPSALRETVWAQWLALPKRWPSVILDAFVVMPNHIHGIFFLIDVQPPMREGRPQGIEGRPQGIAPTVGQVVGAYKSLVFKHCLTRAKQQGKILGPLWQRNYWERVVRNEIELQAIREYIHNNPAQWEMDALYVKARG